MPDLKRYFFLAAILWRLLEDMIHQKNEAENQK